MKVPFSKQQEQSQLSNKVFVGRVTEDMSEEDLRLYFSRFGEVTDVFKPTPFRPFAFITYEDEETARNLCGEDHIIKGVSVYTSSADPKAKNSSGPPGAMGQGGGYNNRQQQGQRGQDSKYNQWSRGPGTSMGQSGGYMPGPPGGSSPGHAMASGNMMGPPPQGYGAMGPGPGPNPNQFNMNMMNPAVLAAALGSWNQVLTGMMGSGGPQMQGSTNTSSAGDKQNGGPRQQAPTGWSRDVIDWSRQRPADSLCMKSEHH